MTERHLCGYRHYEHRSRIKRWFCWFCLDISDHYGTHDLEENKLSVPPMLSIIQRAARQAWKNSRRADMVAIYTKDFGTIPENPRSVL